jgi:hypothetical protein
MSSEWDDRYYVGWLLYNAIPSDFCKEFDAKTYVGIAELHNIFFVGHHG